MRTFALVIAIATLVTAFAAGALNYKMDEKIIKIDSFQFWILPRWIEFHRAGITDFGRDCFGCGLAMTDPLMNQGAKYFRLLPYLHSGLCCVVNDWCGITAAPIYLTVVIKE